MPDTTDKMIIRRLQKEFPLTSEPYKQLSQEIGISETELLERLQKMMASGMLRKMGAVLQHRNAGFHGNALCCWQVPEHRLDEVAGLMAASPFVSHVYLRQPHAKWPYNLYTVFHSQNRKHCLELIQEMSCRVSVTELQVLFSRKNWKRAQLILLQDK